MSSAPTNQGYSLPPIIASASEAAAIVRGAAIEATLGTHELRSRSIIDQKDLPCCVSCALSSAVEGMAPTGPPLSPLFHYYVTRYDRGGADADGFLYLDDGLGTLTIDGICRGDLHCPPFTAAGAATRPSTEAYADALTRALGRRGVRLRYTPIGGPSKAAAIREELAQDHPVVIGMQLPTGYPTSFLNSRFEWIDPDNPAPSLAGHCVFVVGYNDGRTCIRIQDSHGTAPFDNGYWWLGYRVVDSPVVTEGYALVP